MLLSNPFSGAFGLDIGDLNIKMVCLRRQSSPFKQEDAFLLEDLRIVNLPPGYIVNGEILQPELVRKKLLHLLGKEGSQFKPIKTPWVISDLPEPRTFLKLIEIDAPAKTLMNEDVAYHAKKHLPFDLEETYFDWQVVNPDPTKKTSQVLLGAAPKVTADSYTYLLESVGLQPLALEIEALSILRTMVTNTKDYVGEARAILDLGATRSSLIIYDHGTIQMSTSIPFSGGLMTTALSQHLKMSFEEAEKLKFANGLLHDPHRPKYLKILTDLADMLVVEIKKNLEFYSEHFSDPNPITHITMCGGNANFKNLDVVLSRKLKISAKTGNAWKNIVSRSVSDEEKTRGLVLTSALGLALRAARKPLTDGII